MATTAAQWSLQVPKQLDDDLREFLTTERGSASEAEIAAFVEEAVRDRIFDLCAQALKAESAKHDPAFIEELIDEALAWAGEQK
jgi:hypothetical protein